MRILIAAGGSGGHIFPAIALAKAIKAKRRDADIRFAGSTKVLDKRIFEKENFSHYPLSSNKMPYGMSLKLVPFLIRLKIDI